MTLSSDWDTSEQHPLMALYGAINGSNPEDTTSVPGLIAVRGNERNEEDDRTGMEHEILATQNSSLFIQRPTTELEGLLQDNDNDEVNQNATLTTGDEVVPENLTFVSPPLIELENESLDSRSTSSSTRRRCIELEREVEQLRRLLQATSEQEVVPEHLETRTSPTSSLGSASTSSSTRRRNEELQQQLEEARRHLEISNQRVEWLELNQAQRQAVEEHLRNEGQNLGEIPFVYAFDDTESRPFVVDAHSPEGPATASATLNTKKVWWKSWWFIGGVLILVVAVGGVFYYAGAFSVGATSATTSAGSAAAVESAVGVGGATASDVLASSVAVGAGAALSSSKKR